MENYPLTKHRVDDNQQIYSERGLPLVMVNAGPNWDQPILTVERYIKWYRLYLLKKEPKEFYPDVGLNWLKVYAIHYGHLEDVFSRTFTGDGGGLIYRDDVAYVDHTPNPLFVRLFAARNGYRLDEIAEELIEGRWKIEVTDQMVMQCDVCDGTGGTEKDTCRRCCGYGAIK